MGTHNDLTPIKSRIVGYDTKPADQFNAHPHNWRKHPQRQREALAASLRELGWIAPVIENRQTGNLIDGHERVWQALQRGEDVPYMVVDLSPEEEALALATFDAITGMAETDAEALDRLLAEVSTGEAALMELIAETAADARLYGDIPDDWQPDIEQEQARLTLSERFIVPPFSVLDARQGYWQERKRAWLKLGLQGELGRLGEDASSYKSQERLTALVKTGNSKVDPASLPAKQDGVLLIDSYRGKAGQGVINGIMGRPHNAGSTASETGTSIFDPVLTECLYRWFMPPGGHVINPTAGESVYGIVAGYLGYSYQGVELRAEQVAANRQQAIDIGVSGLVEWIEGDGRHTAELVRPADFIICCPPYHDLEVYSDNPQDISTLDDYNEFIDVYRSIVASAVQALKPDRFAAFVVGDIRDKQGHYRNFVSDTIAAFIDEGCQLYNEAILVTPAGSLPVRTSAQFPKGRKLGKSHQNVLIFIKGDWRKAVEACGPVTVEVSDGFGID